MQKYDEEKVAQLKEIMQTRHLGYARTIRSVAYRDLYAWINETVSQFPELDLNAKIYWLTHEMHEWPKCQKCKTNDIVHTVKCNARHGYSMHFCSGTCAQNADTRKAKYNATLAKRTDEMRAKTYEKRVATCMKTYGVENVSQSKEIAQKMSASMLAKTKEELYERTLKTKATKLLRHGDENWQNLEKMKQTISRRTVEQRKQILEKKKDTCRKKYGVDNPMQSDCIRLNAAENMKITARKKTYQSFLNNEHTLPLFSQNDYIATGFEQRLLWKCRHCGTEFSQFIGEHQLVGHYVRCLKCFPLNTNESKPEKALLQLVEDICGQDIEVKSRCRDIIKPKELDIYIPDKHIAIEFNGIFWHSTDLPDQEVDMHLEKTLRCEKLGIRLVHIFEHEWINDKDNVVALLKNTLIGEKTDNDVQLKNNSIEKSTDKVSIKKEDAYEAIAIKKGDDWTLRLKNLNYAYDVNDIIEDAYNCFKQNMNEEVAYVQIDRAKFCANDCTNKFDIVGYTSPKLLIWDRNIPKYDLKEAEENIQYDNVRYAHDCGEIILKMKKQDAGTSPALSQMKEI